MQGLKVLRTSLMRSQGSMKLLTDGCKDGWKTGRLGCTMPAGATKMWIDQQTVFTVGHQQNVGP